MTFDEWWASRPLAQGDLPLVRKAIMDECLSAWLAAQAQRPEEHTLWKPEVRLCPHGDWTYNERESWKDGYFAAMVDYHEFMNGERS